MNKDLTITQYVSQEAVANNIQQVLKDRTPQFITSIVSLVNTNEKLKQCDKKSLLSACLIAASLDLPINQNLGFAFIIPYKDQAQFQMGYKGFIQLAMRSGQFRTINVTDVKEGEIVGLDRLSGEYGFNWIDEKDRAKAKTIGYVAYIKLTQGFEKSLYMTVEDLNKHGLRFSQTKKKGFGLWVDDFDSMAKKTVIKLLLSKYAPMTTEMAKAQEADQAVLTDNGYKYPDNKAVLPEDEANEKEKLRVKNYIKGAKSIAELEMCKEAAEGDVELEKVYQAKRKELENE